MKYISAFFLNLALGLALLLTNSHLFAIYLFVNFCLLAKIIRENVDSICDKIKKEK